MRDATAEQEEPGTEALTGSTPFDRFVYRSPGASRWNRWDAGSGGGYLLLVLAYFLPLVSAQHLSGSSDSDMALDWIWKRSYLGEALRSGRLPLVNPYLMAGHPFLASSQSAVFYPFNWLFA